MEANQELENLHCLLEQAEQREEEFKKRGEELKKREQELETRIARSEQHVARLERQSSTQGDPENATGPHSLLGCKSLHIHGVRAALFEVTLFAYEYKLVTKGVPFESIPHLKHEEKIYERLSPVQGIYVPVCLGSVDLTPRPVWYDGIARIFRLMVLSYAGTLIRHHVNVKDVKQLSQPAGDALKAIHKTGVLHNDPHRGNMVWNTERSCVMFIDFERVYIPEKERPPLGLTSPNRKRKRRDSDPEKESHNMDYDSDFQYELKDMYSNVS